MIDIHGIQPTGPPSPVEPVNPAIGAARPAEAMGVSDVVELSMVAKLAAKIHELPDIRADLVARVKAEIEAGTYETPERLEAAIDKLLEDLLL